jgi:Sulfotransferase domain
MAKSQLRVVGAGVGRTGTNSLKLALERLTGGRCYHMIETFGRPADTRVWRAALHGDPPDWLTFLGEYDAVVDWPACAFWRQLAAANPDAVVLLSMRESAEEWYDSIRRTIFSRISTPPPDGDPDWVARRVLVLEMLAATFTPDWSDRDAAIAAYRRHIAEVRAEVEPNRLVEWRPGDGWQPLCQALGVPEPSEPCPHTNTTSEFRVSTGLEDPAPGG